MGGKPGEALRYRELGYTEGFGCTHFSSETSREVYALLEATQKKAEGEQHLRGGVSPRLRKLKMGLRAVGLPPDKLLHHGSHRIVYGVPLASNFSDVLLGLKDRPQYIVPAKGKPEQSTRLISNYWMRRWLSGRIENPAVLSEVERDTLIFPIEHRGRVVLPSDDEKPSLFSGNWR
jgi:hypothetical protein